MKRARSIVLDDSDVDILRMAGDGSASAGMREMIIIYRDLWALGYRPTIPVKFFVRRYKKKAPIKGPKGSTASPQYNPQGEG